MLRLLKKGLKKQDMKFIGGVNAPYIWLKVPEGYTSWKFFDMLLKEKNVVRNSWSTVLVRLEKVILGSLHLEIMKRRKRLFREFAIKKEHIPIWKLKE